MADWRMQGGELWEHREEVMGTVECSECGGEVPLTAETDEWTQGRRRWEHYGFGPAIGVCCDLLYAEDMWEGAVDVYRLGAQALHEEDYEERRQVEQGWAP